MIDPLFISEGVSSLPHDSKLQFLTYQSPMNFTFCFSVTAVFMTYQFSNNFWDLMSLILFVSEFICSDVFPLSFANRNVAIGWTDCIDILIEQWVVLHEFPASFHNQLLQGFLKIEYYGSRCQGNLYFEFHVCQDDKVLTPRTGPISVCFCIASLTTESRWARGGSYSLHKRCEMSISVVHIVTGSVVHSNRGLVLWIQLIHNLYQIALQDPTSSWIVASDHASSFPQLPLSSFGFVPRKPTSCGFDCFVNCSFVFGTDLPAPMDVSPGICSAKSSHQLETAP